jgi:hypothetical protein
MSVISIRSVIDRMSLSSHASSWILATSRVVNSSHAWPSSQFKPLSRASSQSFQ